jgi:hypothetical protein
MCESSNELWASAQENCLRLPMVFPDLFKEQTSATFGIDGGMCRDEVHALCYAVNDIYNCVGIQAVQLEVRSSLSFMKELSWGKPQINLSSFMVKSKSAHIW